MLKAPTARAAASRARSSFVFGCDPGGRNAKGQEMSGAGADLLPRYDRQIRWIFGQIVLGYRDVVIGDGNKGKIGLACGAMISATVPLPSEALVCM